jgi:hypothetical protein
LKIIDRFCKKNKITYLMDENVRMSVEDIQALKNSIVINSTDQFAKGTLDEVLTRASKENGWIVVTKDIRMALRSLLDSVEVVYISDEFKTISLINVTLYGREKYPEMFDYIQKRFGYSTSPTYKK